MSKFLMLMLTLYGIILLLSIAGISVAEEDTLTYFSLLNSDGILKDLGKNTGLLALCLGAGVVVSILTKTSPDLWVAGSFVAFGFLSLASSFVSIIQYASTMSPWIATLMSFVFSILGVAYLLSGADWVLNRGGN